MRFHCLGGKHHLGLGKEQGRFLDQVGNTAWKSSCVEQFVSGNGRVIQVLVIKQMRQTQGRVRDSLQKIFLCPQEAKF